MTQTSLPAPLRLLVVDGHEVVRQGLVALLARQERLQVVAQVETAAAAIDAARAYHPDIVVMDARLPDDLGIAACREIRAAHAETRVVILSGYADQGAVVGAIVAGASGYLLKQSRGRDLVAALEAIGRGESLLDPAVTGPVLERLRYTPGGTSYEKLAALTIRERQILQRIAEGKTNKQIGAELFLSDKTIKNCVSSILAKLHVRRRAQAAAVARHRLSRAE